MLIWQPRSVDLAAHTVPRRPVRPGGLHDLERPVVRRPPHAGLLGPLAAARLAARRRRWCWRSPRSPPPRCSSRSRAARFGDRPRAGARSCSASGGHAAVHRAAAVRARRRLRAGGRAGAAAAPLRWRVLALLCPLASPVAGLFLALAGVAYALVVRGRDREERCEGLAIGRGARPAAVPDARLPRGRLRAVPAVGLRADPGSRSSARSCSRGAARAALGRCPVRRSAPPLALLLENPMGGNSVRLGALFGGPVLLCAPGAGPLAQARLAPLLVAGFVALALWQWSPAVRDVVKYVEDPGAKTDYFEPLKQFLATLPDQRRIEIPFTRSHWEGAEIAPDSRSRAAGCASSTAASTRSSTGAAQPAHLRELAGRERRALRGAAERQARQALLRRARADRARPALPEAALESDDWRVYEVTLPAPIVVPQGDARIVLEQFGSDQLLLASEAGRGDRARALDALLVRRGRLRAARRRLDPGQRATRAASCGCPPASRRSAVLSAEALRPTERCYRSAA